MSVLVHSHPSNLDVQSSALGINSNHPTPKGVFLPELLEQIFEHLAKVAFEDTQVNHFEKFENFASVYAAWKPPLHTFRRLLPLCDMGSFQKLQNIDDECTDCDNDDSKSLELQVPKLDQDTVIVSSHVDTYRRALRCFSLRKVKDNSINEPLTAVSKFARELTHLDMYICDHLVDTTVMAFITPNLTNISFAGCHQITDASISLIAQSCPKLVHLDLRACGAVSDVSISQIAQSCPRLRHLNVGRIREGRRITYASVKLVAELTEVAVLGLAGCELTDQCIEVLAHARGNGLERLSVNNCHKLTNRSIREVLAYCQRLSVFEMKECHLIDDWEAITELVQRQVLMTLCDQQNRACVKWAKSQGKAVKVRAPIK